VHTRPFIWPSKVETPSSLERRPLCTSAKLSSGSEPDSSFSIAVTISYSWICKSVTAAARDPTPTRNALLGRFRYRRDTVFSQLVGRYSIKRVWARDLWRLMSRLLRKVLSHTVAFLLNHRMGNPPLQLSKLLV
jgi:hypothetical protein